MYVDVMPMTVGEPLNNLNISKHILGDIGAYVSWRSSPLPLAAVGKCIFSGTMKGGLLA